jgi:serine/threonine protein kinase
VPFFIEHRTLIPNADNKGMPSEEDDGEVGVRNPKTIPATSGKLPNGFRLKTIFAGSDAAMASTADQEVLKMSVDKPRVLNDRYLLFPNARRGGMADVYKAADTSADDQIVAIKMFRVDVLDDVLAREAFRRESEAIRNCEHPNIVKLLDTGTDADSKRSFLVLEWLPRNLSDFLQKEVIRDWDNFYQVLGRPILTALALAHAQQIIHRDLKPSNILFGEDDVPKLADFSIAKLKRWREAGVTLADFASEPYVPPDRDSDSSYDRDLFSYAVVVVRCLSQVPLRSYDDIQKAVTVAAVPDDIKAVLKTCLSEPEERPMMAGILLATLDELQRKRGSRDKLRRPLNVVLGGRAREQLYTDFSLEHRAHAERIVMQDLQLTASLCSISPPSSKCQFQLVGADCLYDLALPHPPRDHLIIERARRATPSLLELRRDKAMQLHCNIRTGRPTLSREAGEALEGILAQLENYEAERRLAEAQAKEHEIFESWLSILRAKAELERDRQPAIRYRGVRIEGNQALFSLPSPPPEGIIGQPRQLKADNRVCLSGTVEGASSNELILRIVEKNDADLPDRGELLYDVTLARIAIERQWGAVDGIRYSRCARPRLRDLIVCPEESLAPIPVSGDLKFFHAQLAADKANAVRTAIAAPDFLLVEGPPGTGKTTFIAEVILQTLWANPVARILLTSQTHVALDHVIEALQRLGEPFSAVRIGRIDDPRISASASTLLIERRMEKWRDEALNSGRAFLQNLAVKHDISLDTLRHIALVQNLISSRGRSRELESRIAELDLTLARLSISESSDKKRIVREAKAIKDELDHYRGESHSVDKDINNLERELALLTPPLHPTAASDEVLEAWAGSFLPNTPEVRKLRTLAQIHADWELRCGRSSDFERPFLSSVQLVAATCLGIESSRGGREGVFDLCIVDEASKATATEVLVPLSKSKRWILVGDDRQLPPFVDVALIRRELLQKFDLQEQQLRETLFAHLKTGLPAPCHVELLTQHRMVPAIGKLISACFYENRLTSDERSWDRTFEAELPRPIVWITTASLKSRDEICRDGSYVNILETRIIDSLLGRLDNLARTSGRSFRVGVLTGYSAQRQALERSLAHRMAGTGVNIECNTVDAFQGREVDIVIYSVTRCNSRRKLGFLGEMQRLNVALSRGRDYLVLVGDHHFCRTAADPNPIRPVISYIASHPEDCAIRKAQV